MSPAQKDQASQPSKPIGPASKRLPVEPPPQPSSQLEVTKNSHKKPPTLSPTEIHEDSFTGKGQGATSEPDSGCADQKHPLYFIMEGGTSPSEDSTIRAQALKDSEIRFSFYNEEHQEEVGAITPPIPRDQRPKLEQPEDRAVTLVNLAASWRSDALDDGLGSETEMDTDTEEATRRVRKPVRESLADHDPLAKADPEVVNPFSAALFDPSGRYTAYFQKLESELKKIEEEEKAQEAKLAAEKSAKRDKALREAVAKVVKAPKRTNSKTKYASGGDLAFLSPTDALSLRPTPNPSHSSRKTAPSEECSQSLPKVEINPVKVPQGKAKGTDELKPTRKKATCTRATKIDTINLVREAVKITDKFNEAEMFQARMLERVCNMVRMGKQKAEESGTEPEGLCEMVAKLKDCLEQCYDLEILMGRHPVHLDQEIEWVNWIEKACAAGVMHLRNKNCDCRMQL